METIRYNTVVNDCSVLGPGKRAVLWVHGCCFDCPGCIAYNYNRGPWKEATPDELAQWYVKSGADGLTISGGEPMLQAAALTTMMRLVRQQVDCGLIVYSGYQYDELLELAHTNGGVSSFLRQIDLLIDGRYVQELDDGRPYVGSSNQNIRPLTQRYAREVHTYYEQATGRDIEIRFSEQRTLLLGVPAKEQAAFWQRIKTLGDDHAS